MKPKTAGEYARLASRSWLIWMICLAGIAALFALSLLRSTSARLGYIPNPALIGWLLFYIGAVAILIQPRYGVYLTVFLTLAGDSILIPWYPFNKNFSSGESLFYVNNSLIFSPLEAYLALTLLSWLVRAGVTRKLDLRTGPLFWPTLTFTGFTIFGLAWGLSHGGSLNIGLWEARPIFYLPLMFILASNLLRERQHVNRVMWAAMLALFIEGIAGNIYYFITIKMDLGSVEAITEHSAAIHMNTLIVFILCAFLFRASRAKRLILPLLLPCVMLTYLATQRRSAFLSLAIAMVLLTIFLYRENRRAFWSIVPPLAVFAMLYIAAFWNSSGALALPAQAVKSVVAPDTSSKDYMSNLYRTIENVNTNFTIHQVPLTGVGFGRPFYIIVAMPDISFFIWWQYITHNSILWMWMQTGAGGFFSMLYMVGLAIVVGARAAWRMPSGDMSAAALTAAFYIIMHFLYAYADMSWDNQSMIYVGLMMGLINSMERIVAQPIPTPAKRWHWEPEPQPAPGLLPVPADDDTDPIADEARATREEGFL